MKRIRCSECNRLVPEDKVTWIGSHRHNDVDTGYRVNYDRPQALCRRCCDPATQGIRPWLAMGLVLGILIALLIWAKLSGLSD